MISLMLLCIFFNGVPLPPGVTATTLVLIPKKEVTSSWSYYRPISLCNNSHKIITKLFECKTGSPAS